MKKAFSQVAALALSAGLFAQTISAQTPPPAAPQTPPPAAAAPAPPPPVAATVTEPTTPPKTNAPKATDTKAAPKTAKKKSAPKKAAPKKEDAEPKEAASTYTPAPATVKQDRVNVRGQASLIGEVITQLKKGESVTILDEVTVKASKAGAPAVWAKIAMPTNVPVWVNTEFLDANTKAVKSTKLNVRAGPGENFSIIGRLKKGDTVKEIRQVDTWTEIETPAGTFGFVSLDLLVKGDSIASAKTEAKPATEEPKKPEPVKEVVKVDSTPAPAPEPAKPEKPAAVPDPAVVPLVLPPSPPIEDKPIKRIVRREGVVSGTISIQAPTSYQLDDPFDGRMINYLTTELEGVKLKEFKGAHLIVTGEEYIDKRWPRTPILKIEKLEVVP